MTPCKKYIFHYIFTQNNQKQICAELLESTYSLKSTLDDWWIDGLNQIHYTIPYVKTRIVMNNDYTICICCLVMQTSCQDRIVHFKCICPSSLLRLHRQQERKHVWLWASCCTFCYDCSLQFHYHVRRKSDCLVCVMMY